MVCKPNLRLHWECYCDCCTASDFAVHLNMGVMDHRRVLDDGQAQSGAAHFLGMALIHPIEPLKNAIQMLMGDADSGIPDSNGMIPHGDGDAAARAVILDGIIAEIINHGVHQFGDSTDHG